MSGKPNQAKAASATRLIRRVSVVLVTTGLVSACGSATRAGAPRTTTEALTVATRSMTAEVALVEVPFLAADAALEATQPALEQQLNTNAVGTAGLKAAISGEISAFAAFSSSVAVIDVGNFPPITADYRAMLTAVAAVEKGWAQAAANTGTAARYNAAVVVILAASDRYGAADSRLRDDFGMLTAHAYAAAFNRLRDSVTPLLSVINNPPIGTRALKAALGRGIGAYRAFQASVSTIEAGVNPGISHDLSAVASAADSIEIAWGTLLAAADSQPMYDEAANADLVAESSFQAANEQAGKDLGLSTQGSP